MKRVFGHFRLEGERRQDHAGGVRELLHERVGLDRPGRLLRADDPQRLAHLRRRGVVRQQLQPPGARDAQGRPTDRRGDQGPSPQNRKINFTFLLYKKIF